MGSCCFLMRLVFFFGLDGLFCMSDVNGGDFFIEVIVWGIFCVGLKVLGRIGRR